MSSASEQPDTHVVVFDINVYLDVARLLGPPFTWNKFHAAAAQYSSDPVPHPKDTRVDSLRALAVCLSKKFVSPEPLEVWTSTNIDVLVVRKASQPDDRTLPDEDRGLGWDEVDAVGLRDDLVDHVVYAVPGGGTTGDVVIAEGSPPLSNEDGRVLRTAVEAGEHYALKYCVTQDVEFRRCGPDLPVNVQVMHPHEWVSLVRRSRAEYARSRFPGLSARPVQPTPNP